MEKSQQSGLIKANKISNHVYNLSSFSCLAKLTEYFVLLKNQVVC